MAALDATYVGPSSPSPRAPNSSQAAERASQEYRRLPRLGRPPAPSLTARRWGDLRPPTAPEQLFLWWLERGAVTGRVGCVRLVKRGATSGPRGDREVPCLNGKLRPRGPDLPAYRPPIRRPRKEGARSLTPSAWALCTRSVALPPLEEWSLPGRPGGGKRRGLGRGRGRRRLKGFAGQLARHRDSLSPARPVQLQSWLLRHHRRFYTRCSAARRNCS